jgi:hypothetical protein
MHQDSPILNSWESHRFKSDGNRFSTSISMKPIGSRIDRKVAFPSESWYLSRSQRYDSNQRNCGTSRDPAQQRCAARISVRPEGAYHLWG